MSKKSGSKHKDYEMFIGDYVIIYLKSTIMTEKDMAGQEVVGTALKMFLVDVTEHSLIVGHDPNEAYGVIPLDEVGPLMLSDDIPDELKFPTPPIEEQN